MIDWLMDRMIWVVAGFFVLLFVAIIGNVIYESVVPCKKSHTEQQIQMPLNVVVGGSKYGGGVGIPIGNGKIVNVVVCDKR